LEDVLVTAQMTGQSDTLSGKTDKKGEGRINGAANGAWQRQGSKESVEPATEMIEVKGDKAPPLNVTLKKAADPMVVVNSKLQEAATLAQAGKLPDARKIYEDLLAKYPQIYQLEGFIARTYAAENNVPQALEHLKINLDHETNPGEE